MPAMRAKEGRGLLMISWLIDVAAVLSASSVIEVLGLVVNSDLVGLGAEPGN